MAETPSGIETKALAPAETITETPVNSKTARVEIQESTSTVEEKKAAYSLLKIDSVPTNAQVFIDDAFKGKTPVDLSLPLGKHEVLVTLRGYYEWEAGIDLDTPGETPLYVRLIAEE